MLNIIKSDLYRMIHTKSFFITTVVFIGFLILTTFLLKVESVQITTEGTAQVQTDDTSSDDNVNLGMSVAPNLDENNHITVTEDFYSNVSAKVVALFLVIFTATFVMGEFNSGYIKNMAGQLKNRQNLIFSKMVALFCYTIIIFLITIITMIIGHRVILGYLVWGNIKQLITYALIQIVLNYALSVSVMTIAILLRNSVGAIIIAVCLCMNVMTIAYAGINAIIGKAGVKNFNILKYTLTGKIAMLPVNAKYADNMQAIMVGLVFIIVLMLISCMSFKKRDIV